jgi:hypothetical protein
VSAQKLAAATIRYRHLRAAGICTQCGRRKAIPKRARCRQCGTKQKLEQRRRLDQVPQEECGLGRPAVYEARP